MIVLRITRLEERTGAYLRWGVVVEDSLGRAMARAGGTVTDTGAGRERIYDAVTATLEEPDQ